MLSLDNGKILIAGRTANNIALTQLLGDSNQNALSANLAPVNSVPTEAQIGQLNRAVAFSDYNNNLISISDDDAGLNPVKVTLTAQQGVITLVKPDPQGGLTYIEGDGFEDTTMTFTGKITDINEALSWVAFTPAQDYLLSLIHI